MGNWGKEGKVTYGNPNHGRMRLDPILVASAEEAEGRDGARGDELDGKDGVDFSDELMTDLDCGFGYRTTELFLEWSC